MATMGVGIIGCGNISGAYLKIAPSFRDVEVHVLGGGHALALGRYEVRIPGREMATGPFSLTLRRTPQGWRIIHDHSG